MAIPKRPKRTKKEAQARIDAHLAAHGLSRPELSPYYKERGISERKAAEKEWAADLCQITANDRL